MLTEREREIVSGVATGLSNDEIASALHLSPATVRTHVSHALPSSPPATAPNSSRSPATPASAERQASAFRRRQALTTIGRKLIAMSVTLDLPEDVLQRLTAEAKRRGVELSEVVSDLATQLPAAHKGRRRRLAFVGAGASASGITGRMDQLLDEGFGRD